MSARAPGLRSCASSPTGAEPRRVARQRRRTVRSVQPRTIADGLVLRRATDADAEQIIALNAAAHGQNEEHATRVLLAHDEPDVALPGADDRDLTTGVDDWTVVVEGDRVVSVCALFAHRLRIADVVLPVGQVEYVATVEEHRRKGLVRAQIDAHHERSEQRGDLLTLITGIPHYYRRFGYGYALDWPERFVVPEHLDAPEAIDVRPAGEHDLDALVALADAAQRRVGVALQRSWRSWWSLVTEGPGWNDRVLVAVQAGEVVGSVRLLQWPEEPVAELVEGAASSVEAGRALLAEGRRRVGASELCSFDRLGDPYSMALHEVGLPTRRWHPTYARVPDPVALVQVLQPVLSRRLSHSPFAAEQGEVVLSLYTSGIRIAYAQGEVTAIEAAPGIEDPEDQGGVGVAPDALPALVLGRFGASGLERRVDDVFLGRHHDLLDVLFPRLSNDHVFAT